MNILIRLNSAILLFAFFLCTLSACTKQPTISETTVDLRPALSFKQMNESQNAAVYTVYVDGLAYGTADQYLSGVAALKVLSGSHVVQLKKNNQIVFEEKIYLGDSAVKTLPLPL